MTSTHFLASFCSSLSVCNLHTGCLQIMVKHFLILPPVLSGHHKWRPLWGAPSSPLRWPWVEMVPGGLAATNVATADLTRSTCRCPCSSRRGCYKSGGDGERERRYEHESAFVLDFDHLSKLTFIWRPKMLILLSPLVIWLFLA